MSKDRREMFHGPDKAIETMPEPPSLGSSYARPASENVQQSTDQDGSKPKQTEYRPPAGLTKTEWEEIKKGQS